jgi:hypothetical protein
LISAPKIETTSLIRTLYKLASKGERKDSPFFTCAFENGKLNILKVRELINETAKEACKVIDFFENGERELDELLIRTGFYDVQIKRTSTVLYASAKRK